MSRCSEGYGRVLRQSINTGAGLSYESLLPLGLADGVILVSTPRLAAVRDTRKTKDLAERVGNNAEGIIFSRSGTGTAPPPERIADILDVKLLGHVPDDTIIPEAQDAGLPVVAYNIATPAARAYWTIAQRLIGVANRVEVG